MKPKWLLERHLTGQQCLGFYFINPADDTVTCAAADFDDHDGDNPDALSDAKTLYQYLKDQGRSPVLELSQSGAGAHVWIFFSRPIEARKVRSYLQDCLRACQIEGIEIYPRQDSVQHLEARMGSLMRYPLWNKSCFVDLHLRELDPNEVMECVAENDPDEIPEPATHLPEVSYSGFDCEGLPDRVLDILNSEPTSLLAKRWTCDVSGMLDDSRSALCQSISTELVRYMVPTPEIEAALRYWCARYDYDKPDEWYKRTIVNAYNYGLQQKARTRDSSELLWNILHKNVDVIAQGIPLIPTGLKVVDRSIKGIALGEYGLICGRPSQGKTAWTFEWLDHAASIGYGAEYLSLEMSALATTCRFLPRLGFKVEDIANLSVRDIHRAVEDYGESKKAPIYFSDRTDSGNELDSLVEHIKDSHRRRGVQLFAIDYSELVVADYSSTYESQVKIHRTLAQLTRHLNIAILMLVQLKRPESAQSSNRPALHHLKFSGEQEADMVLGCRWWHQENPEYDKTLYTIYGLKNKNRGVMEPDMEINFHAEQQTFSNRDAF